MDPLSAGGGHGQSMGLVVGVVVALAVLLLRNRRPRKLRIEFLWIRPLVFVALIALALAAAPPPLSAASLAGMAGALAVGCALGWQRGRLMRIEVDPATHALTSRASPVGLVFILAILALRMGLRGVVLESRSVFGLPTAAITDALILLAGGMMIVQSLEMWLRARRLLALSRKAEASDRDSSANPPMVP